jgi:hypothetical protein
MSVPSIQSLKTVGLQTSSGLSKTASMIKGNPVVTIPSTNSKVAHKEPSFSTAAKVAIFVLASGAIYGTVYGILSSQGRDLNSEVSSFKNSMLESATPAYTDAKNCVVNLFASSKAIQPSVVKPITNEIPEPTPFGPQNKVTLSPDEMAW